MNIVNSFVVRTNVQQQNQLLIDDVPQRYCGSESITMALRNVCNGNYNTPLGNYFDIFLFCNFINFLLFLFLFLI